MPQLNSFEGGGVFGLVMFFSGNVFLGGTEGVILLFITMGSFEVMGGRVLTGSLGGDFVVFFC